MKDTHNHTIAETPGGGKRPSLYRAYLIRCWLEETGTGDGPAWRFSLEEVLHRRRRVGFCSLEALLRFLETELGAEAGQPGDAR